MVKIMSVAVTVFWATPELVEKILPYLDLASTLSLVKAHGVTQAIVQRSLNWDKLVRLNCPFHHPSDLDHFYDCRLREEKVEPKINLVRGLVAILKVLTNLRTLLPNLLDVICERFSARAPTIPNDQNEIDFSFPVLVSCSSYPNGQNVSLLGFVLIEEAESAFGTSMQRLVSMSLPADSDEDRDDTLTLSGSLLSALTSR